MAESSAEDVMRELLIEELSDSAAAENANENCRREGVPAGDAGREPAERGERADFGVINNDGLAELELQIGRLVRLLNGSVR